MNDRYRIERLPNGLLRVFDYASKLSACYHANGTYAHGDLYATTLDALLAVAADQHDYLTFPRLVREQMPIEEVILQ